MKVEYFKIQLVFYIFNLYIKELKQQLNIDFFLLFTFLNSKLDFNY